MMLGKKIPAKENSFIKYGNNFRMQRTVNVQINVPYISGFKTMIEF